MHDRAHGSGAPRGNRNALRHGLYTAESLARRRRVNRLLRDGASLLRHFEKRPGRPAAWPDHTAACPTMAEFAAERDVTWVRAVVRYRTKRKPSACAAKNGFRPERTSASW